MTKTYTVGETAIEDVEFKVGGVLTDPDTVTATVSSPSSVESSPTITSTGTGKRRITWPLSEEGDWFLEVVSTGAAAGRKETFVYARRSFVPDQNLIAEALVTVAEMRFFLDRTGETVDLDEYRWVEDLINAYSVACASYTNRKLAPERTPVGGAWPMKIDPLATAVAKTFRYDGDGYLSLGPYDARTITEVVIGVDLPTGQQVTLFAGDVNREREYRLEPPQKTTLGTYRWLTLPDAGSLKVPWRSSMGFAGRQVRVTGDWGPALIRPDIAHACKIAVGDAFRNPEDYARRVAAGLTVEEVPPEGPGSLPSAALRILHPYRLP